MHSFVWLRIFSEALRFSILLQEDAMDLARILFLDFWEAVVYLYETSV